MIFGIGFGVFCLSLIITPVLDYFDLLDKHHEKVGYGALVGLVMMVGSGVAYLTSVLP